MLQILETLVTINDVYVCVISGRSVNNVKTMVGIDEITYAGKINL